MVSGLRSLTVVPVASVLSNRSSDNMWADVLILSNNWQHIGRICRENVFYKKNKSLHKFSFPFLVPRRVMEYKQKRHIEWEPNPTHVLHSFV